MAEAKDLSAAYDALRQAHANGDTKSAQKLADYIRSQGMGYAPTEGATPVDVDAASGAARTVADWFKPREPEVVAPKEVAGAMGGGAVAGAAAGAALPGVLKAAGKVIPGPIGRFAEGAGEAMSALPLRERMIRGAGGGAAMGLVDEAGKAMGAPEAVTFGAGIAAGGAGETAASFLTKTASKMLHFVSNIAYGNVPGVSRAFSGIFSPNRELNEAAAKKMQQKLFGGSDDWYVDHLVGSDNRIATQEALRKADPSLNGIKQGVRPPWETSTGEMTPLSPERGIVPRGPGGTPPSPGERPALPAPEGALPESFARGKKEAQEKGAAARKQAEDMERITQMIKPASQIYRERMFQGVTDAVKQGQTFSTTPEFAEFRKKLVTEVQLGNISNADYQNLMKSLTADRLKNPAVRAKYAETVDNRIREWGKQLEGKPATGAAAVDSATATEIRGALRDAFNQYTSRIGLGDIEAKYRNAYSAEKLAKAKDELPYFLYGYGSASEFQKMSKSLARDPQGLPFIQGAVAKHLANTPPKDIAGEFERLQKVLVNAKLVDPADLKQLRIGAEAVKRTNDKGLKMRASQQLQQMLMMAMARQGGISAGQAAGRRRPEEEEE